MEANKRVETLENEFKLIKGELKQTLASVRDYLTSFKLPPPGDAEFLKYIDGEEKQQVIMGGAISHTSDVSVTQPTPAPGSGRLEKGSGSPEGSVAADELADSLPETPDSAPPSAEPSPGSLAYQAAIPGEFGAAEEEPPEPKTGYGALEWMERARDENVLERGDRKTGEEAVIDQSTPRVNLLSNLIRWVASAKKDLGDEQLAAFLEVYGVSGNLSPELKEIILNLVEVTEAAPADTSAADVWSRLILELHGILTGGYAPLHTVTPLWKDEAGGAELEEEVPEDEPEDKQEDKPLKLKLGFTDGEGKDKEFSVDLTPEAGGEDSSRSSSDASETN